MNKIKVEDIVRITNATLVIGDEKEICENFSKDTRTIQNGDIYIGIKGDKFDGNNLWQEALQKGAKGVIIQDKEISEDELRKWNKKIIIKVDETMQALYKIAEYKRCLYNIPIIGITGSVGKTSTKDIVANVLSQKYKTLKTERNNNNNIGLPFTILKLKDHEAAVLEMGMNHFDEIRLLTKIAKPTLSIITNIGTSHIGNLGSRENILKAKLEILESMEEPILIINNDNDLLSAWYEENKNKIKIHTYGIKKESEVMAKDIHLSKEKTKITCEFSNEKIDIEIPIGGEHFVYNAICGALVGKILGIEKEKIKVAIEGFKLTKKRMDIEELENGVKIINDCYNASIESIDAALKYLSEYKLNRKIAVLGDMFELGKFSEKIHREVGKKVVENKVDILFCCGENAINIKKEAEKLGMKKIFYFNQKEEMQEKLKDIVESKDIVLIKASNGMNFFTIIDFLKGN